METRRLVSLSGSDVFEEIVDANSDPAATKWDGCVVAHQQTKKIVVVVPWCYALADLIAAQHLLEVLSRIVRGGPTASGGKNNSSPHRTSFISNERVRQIVRRIVEPMNLALADAATAVQPPSPSNVFAAGLLGMLSTAQHTGHQLVAYQWSDELKVSEETISSAAQSLSDGIIFKVSHDFVPSWHGAVPTHRSGRAKRASSRCGDARCSNAHVASPGE